MTNGTDGAVGQNIEKSNMRKAKKKKLNEKLEIWFIRLTVGVYGTLPTPISFGNDDNSVAKLAAYTRQTKKKIEKEKKMI